MVINAERYVYTVSTVHEWKSRLNSIMIASFFMFFDVNATKLNYNHAVRYLSSAIKDIKLYNRVYCTSF